MTERENVIERDNVILHDVARFRTQLFDRLMRPHGLTMSQTWVLIHLIWKDRQTQSELARRMQVGAVTLGGLVDRLEARGLVERQSDDQDRRANRVCLTEASRGLGKVMNAKVEQVNEVAYRGLSEEDKETVTRCLKMIRDNLLGELRDEKPTDSDASPEQRLGAG